MQKPEVIFTLGVALSLCLVNVEAQTHTELFRDDGTGAWADKWFLDGQTAIVTNEADGMSFWAGPTAGSDSSHAVLWTNQVFTGDIRIEYNYTRLDRATTFVNILYIQATGSGLHQYNEDISQWRELRATPSMSHYYNHMNTLHMSYAALGKQGDKPYIRARRYLPESGNGLRGTQLSPDFDPSGLFATGVEHRVVVEKVGAKITVKFENANQKTIAVWDTSQHPNISKGRIGLRHMSTRGARYANFVVSRITGSHTASDHEEKIDNSK